MAAGDTRAGRSQWTLNVVPITAFIMGLSSAVLGAQQPPFHAAEGYDSSLCVCACVFSI